MTTGGDQNYSFGDERDAIIAKIRAAKGTARLIFSNWADDEPDREPIIRAALRDALGNERRILVAREALTTLAEIDLERLKPFPNFVGVIDVADGSAEVHLRSESPMFSPRQLPGVKYTGKAAEDDSLDDADQFTEDPEEDLDDESGGWLIELTTPSLSETAEISPATNKLDFLRRRPGRGRDDPSLKIRGLRGSAANQVARFHELASSTFFEIDIRFGRIFSLDDREPFVSLRRSRRRDSSSEEAPLSLASVAYSKEAVELYFYGRSARGVPLLEFLAYYQAIEYFYPQFTRLEAIRRVRQALRHPGFNRERDEDVTRLLGLLEQKRNFVGTEEDQFRTTLEHCVDESEIADYLDSSPEVKESLSSKTTISQVHVVNFSNPNMSILTQVAKRLYGIRCRIVHSKSDGGPRNSELLLPGSPETKNLQPETDLLKHLSQKVIVAGGSSS